MQLLTEEYTGVTNINKRIVYKFIYLCASYNLSLQPFSILGRKTSLTTPHASELVISYYI